uniref:Uncharacterized protein n=1 Tax=Arundo donax TaxID=35708 RepID=A0A0A9CEF6_ARUDO
MNRTKPAGGAPKPVHEHSQTQHESSQETPDPRPGP